VCAAPSRPSPPLAHSSYSSSAESCYAAG
jgi:hypothetical protein